MTWKIGCKPSETYQDPAYQDRVEAEALCDLLERETVPTFYDRRADGLPPRWVDTMKSSRPNCAQSCYLVANGRHRNLHADNAARAKALTSWKKRVEAAWPKIRIEPLPSAAGEVELGKDVTVSSELALYALTCDDCLYKC